ncbi:MAG: hypothetical protein CME88_07715 [Hirschia sp.]|nr:hypothetical protein [Hirschia sp.]MBF18246.1 hypothetical protein [Hirschia sp.]|tara:strand:+ start:203 stop:511 length:309 start_codon:yes stop_codon:yes gene_type:complete
MHAKTISRIAGCFSLAIAAVPAAHAQSAMQGGAFPIIIIALVVLCFSGLIFLALEHAAYSRELSAGVDTNTMFAQRKIEKPTHIAQNDDATPRAKTANRAAA